MGPHFVCILYTHAHAGAWHEHADDVIHIPVKGFMLFHSLTLGDSTAPRNVALSQGREEEEKATKY